MASRVALPLTAAQTELWYRWQEARDSAVFNVAGYYDIRGPFEPELWTAAVRQVVREAETLRVRFEVVDDEPRQVIEPAGVDVPVLDLAGEPDPAAAAEELMWAQVRTPFDPSAPLVPRCVLYRLGAGRWRFFMCLHHLAVDGFSQGLLLKRLTDVYDALVSGRPSGEDALVPLEVLVDDDRAYHAGSAEFDRDRALWTDRFPCPPEPTSLSGRAPALATDVVRRSARLSRSDAERLRESAWRARVALPELVVAATAAFAGRMTGSRDVLLTLLTTARRGAAARRAPGVVANPLPLPLTVRPEMTRGELLAHTAEEVRRTVRHQRYRGRLVRGHLGLPGDVRPFGPAVNVLGLGETRAFGGCTATGRVLSTGPVDDLELIVGETGGDGLFLDVNANPALYTGDELAGLLTLFVDFLAEFANFAGDRPLARLEAGPARPRWGDGEPCPTENLGELLRAVAGTAPGTVAVLEDDRTWSYGQLLDLARKVGAGLVAAGAGAESVVGVVGEPGGGFAGAVLGVWAAGGAYLPVEPLEESAVALADSGAGFLVTPPSWRTTAEKIAARVPGLRVLVVEDLPEAAGFGFVPRHESSAAFVSGPVVCDAGLMNQLRARIDELGITAADTVLQNAPLTSGGSVWQLFAALAVGGRVRVAGDVRNGVTVAEVTPSVLRDGKALPGVRKVVVTGEPLRDAGLTTAYGLTECSGAVLIGRPVRNTRIAVLGPDLRPVPDGVAGEVYAGGAGVARGFAGDPAGTSARFVADPAGPPGSRMVRTGDRARWTRTGELEYLDTAALRGVRLDLAAIGAALRGLDGVRAAVAVVRPDPAGDPFLAGYVEGDPDESAAREAMTAGLPAAVKPAVLVTKVDRIPLDRKGKIDRARLPEPSWPAAPGEKPRDEREAALAELFAEVLGQPGAGDDFFALGGHSLLAIRLVRRIREVFGTDLPVSAVFEAPTVAALTATIAANGGSARPALRTAKRPDRVPLSYAQQRLWFLEEYGEAGSAYHVPVLVRLSGPVDTAALHLALGDVLTRHESLRTVFPAHEQVPYQHVLDPDTALRRLPFDTVPVAEADLDAAVAVAAGRPFALATDLPLRARLFRLAPENHVLLLVMHHITGDAMSWAPVWRDFTAAYETRARGEIPAPPELPAQYADFAVWQREMLGSESDPDSLVRRQLDFWRTTLEGAPDELPLPFDRPRAAASTPAGGRVPFGVDADTHSRLGALAHRSGATVFMVVQAAFALLLAKLGAGTDIPIGTACAGRPDQALDDLVGFFVNTVVLRTDVSGDPSFEELLARVRETDLAAFAHQDVPFELVVDALNPARSLTRNPLFQVMVVARAQADRHGDLAGARATVEELHTATAKFDLLLDYAESSGGGLAGALEYRTDLFDAETAERLSGRLSRVLEAVAAAPGRAISDLDVLDDGERRQVLTTWNDTAHPVPAVTMPELFAARARATPDAPAVVFEGETVTYAELSARVDRLAGVLAAAGAGPERVVAVVLPRSVELIVALHAIARSGAAFLPVDPDYPAQRIGHLLGDAAPVLVVTDAAAAALIPSTVDSPVLSLDDGLPPSRPLAEARPHGDSAAYVLYTSGSTGRPKGVVVSHAALANRVLWMQGTYRLSTADRVLQKTSCGFDVSVWEFFWPLVTGAALVVARPDGHRDPWYLAEVIRREGVTDLHFVPSMLREFLRVADPAACASLRRVYCSGEALSPALRADFHARLGAELHNLYGPTEAAIDVTAWASPPAEELPVVPIGRPVWNTRLYVLDDRLRPVPPGAPGELYLAGIQLARGYRCRAGLTAERFVASPFGDGERLYRTGDRARWNRHGEVEYLGRADHQVKIRGVRIEPGEIEAVLRGHDTVADAVVLAVPDAAGDRELVAYVVAASGSGCDTEVLRAHAAGRLPAVMVPAAIVPLDAFPVTPHGKLDRAALPRPQRTAGSTGVPSPDLPGRLPVELPATARERLAGLAAEAGVSTGAAVRAVWTILVAKLGLGEDVPPLPGSVTVRDVIRRSGDSGEPGYEPGLFGPAGPAELRACFEAAAEGVLAAPDAPAITLDLGAEAAPQPAREEVTATLVNLWQAQVAVSADRVAVTCGREQVTYRELDARANRLAHALIARGIGPDRLVALLLPRSADLVVAVLAVLKAGGAYLPLDPECAEGHLGHVLGDARPSLVISPHAVETGVPCLPLDDPAIATHPHTPPGRRILPGQLAYVIYTSGSTGRAKGVLVTHGNVTRLFASAARRFRFGPDQVWTLYHSYAFDFSVWELWGALLHGGRLVVVPLDTARTPRDFRRLLAEERVTTLCQTPSAFLHLIADEAEAGHTPDLRTVIFGGEALEPRRLADWYARRSGEEPLLVNMYGITETSVHVTYRELGPDSVTHDGSPIGVPLPDLRVFVLDRGLRPVPAGVPGELYVAGPGLARGYLGRAGLTAGRFVACPFGDGERMYRTGDLGRWSHTGELEFTGRADGQLKISGYRIEPGEIEAVLAGHPAVGEVAAGAAQDQRGGSQLTAYVVPAAGAALDVDELRAWTRTQLPAYLVPSAFLVLRDLPLTPNGKLDRQALPGPVFSGGRGRRPATAAEEKLCALFAEVLGVERVSPDDGFFELGGHSLLAARLVGRIHADFGVPLSVRAVFEEPTVAKLLAAIERAAVTAAPPSRPARVPRPSRLPLSPAQEQIWVEQRLSGPSPLYNITAAARLSGVLDREALRAALADVVARHESLRTVVADTGGVAHLVIRDHAEPVLPVTEVSAGALDAAVAAHAREPFDLSEDLPLRARLFVLGAHEHVLSLVVHHIAADGWSLDPLARDLSRAYAARARGQAPDWAPLPLQYADHVLARRDRPDDGQLEFWRRALDGLPEDLPLPTDRPRPATPSHRGDVVEFTVDAGLHRGIADLAAAAGATEFMVVHAALATLLGKLGVGSDIAIGTPVAGRGDPALDDLVGLFVNTLVLRVDLSGRPTFRELLGRVRETDVAALAHQDVPVTRVTNGRRPFGVLLAFQTTAEPRLDLPGLTAEIVPAGTGTAKFDLSFALVPRRGEGMRGYLEFATDLFDRATAEALTARLVRVLAAAVAAPDAAAGGIDVLAPAERDLVLAASHGPLRRLPEATVPELFAATAAERGDETAVLFDGAEISYRELDERANRLAHVLIGKGAGPERIVALRLPPSIELVVALLAVLKSGAAYLTIDPAYPAERIAHLLAEARPTVVLTPGDLGGDGPSTAPEVPLRPDHAAYVVFTSGSTGTPKGVVVEHRNVVALVADHVRRFGMDHETRILQFAPLGFDAAAGEILVALLAGAVLVPVPAERRVPGEPLARLVAETGANFVALPPTVLATLPPGGLPGGITLMTAGEECPPRLAERWAPGRRLVNAYGPTETTVTVTVTEPLETGSPVTIGRPLDNAEAHVLDESLRPVPPGVPGELYLGGAQVSRGYLRRPGLTASRFVAAPDGARLYRSGDLAAWTAEGTLAYLGRADDQVKIRGFRVEPGEVEVVLSGHPAVRQATVLLREDRPGHRQLVAYYVGDDAPLREYLRERLPAHMVPAAVLRLTEFPRTPHGKLDRAALPAPRFESGAAEPRTEAERVLCAVLAEVLGLASVGVEDSFFDLGGDSISALQVVSRARKAGWTLHPRDVLLGGTAAKMAAAAEPARGVSVPEIDPAGPVEDTPMAAWLRGAGGAAGAGFNQSMLVRTPAGIGLPELHTVLAALLDHHDALRLVATGDGLEVRPPGAVAARVLRVDVTGLEPEARQAELTRRGAAAQAELDPAAGELLRAVWFDAGPAERGRLLLVVHHLAVDGVSWRILLEDLATAWTAVREDRAPALEPVGTSVRQWARLLNERLPEVTADLEGWAEVMRDVRPWLGRPLDPARDTAATLRRLRLDLPAEPFAAAGTAVLEPLLAALALSAAGFRRRRGDQDSALTVTLEGHGRDEFDLSRTVGWFTTLYPVRLDPGPSGGTRPWTDPRAVHDVLRRTREQLHAGPADRRGYGLLRFLHPEHGRVLGALPAPPIVFNHLGRYAAGAPADWAVAPEPSPAPGSGPGMAVPAVLTVNTALEDGPGGLRLVAHWIWAGNCLTGEEAHELADGWAAAVTALATATDPGLTLSGLGRDELDELADGLDGD
ncbi:amino acid adenylation domain-containing protein [Amycolatopsis sp. NPDC021455]|uniref:amino acid adenylation domain-containing protein n=1 Tax=Amycolatopsis sp. NPDC021455 TaxID=3154901 RepID=UPI0033E076F7